MPVTVPNPTIEDSRLRVMVDESEGQGERFSAGVQGILGGIQCG